MPKVYINGKFLAQRTTGVQRFSKGILLALDRNLSKLGRNNSVVLLCPPCASDVLSELTFIEQRRCGTEALSLTAWEQICLPFASRDGYLICLSGSAPLLSRRCIPTIHDAAVFLFPHAYSAKFVSWYRFLFKRIAKKAPFVFTVSESSARDLASFLPNCNFRIVPNSAEHITYVDVDHSILSSLGLKQRRFVLAVGSLNPTKNFKTLIDAYTASDLCKIAPLVIVGAINANVFHSSELISTTDVIWAGSVSDEQLRALYEAATAFVFPSLYEGFGIPPIEAMLCGCPVIASDISAIREVCGDAVAYFPPTDGAALIDSLRRILYDESMRKELIDRGHQRSQSFSWDLSAQRLRQALAEFHILSI